MGRSSLSVSSLSGQVLVSVLDFCDGYQNDSQHDYGLEYLAYKGKLEELLAPDQPLPSLEEVSENLLGHWKRGCIPNSVRAMYALREVLKGLNFPITYASLNMDLLNIIAAYAFFSGFLSEGYNVKISVPNIVLVCRSKDEEVCMATLDKRLSHILSNYDCDTNHLMLSEGGCAIGRVLELLEIPQQSKSTLQIEFPLYIQVAAKDADPWKDYKAWRLVNDWVKVMILSKGRKEGCNLRITLFSQPDEESARYLCLEAQTAISCIFPYFKDRLHHHIYPMKSKSKATPAKTLYEPRLTFKGGAKIVRNHYKDDKRIVTLLK